MILINQDYDHTHKRYVATLPCNTLYLLIYLIRQDLDARLANAPSLLPSTVEQ
jgi:hypothetical protein